MQALADARCKSRYGLSVAPGAALPPPLPSRRAKSHRPAGLGVASPFCHLDPLFDLSQKAVSHPSSAGATPIGRILPHVSRSDGLPGSSSVCQIAEKQDRVKAPSSGRLSMDSVGWADAKDGADGRPHARFRDCFHGQVMKQQAARTPAKAVMVEACSIVSGTCYRRAEPWLVVDLCGDLHCQLHDMCLWRTARCTPPASVGAGWKLHPPQSRLLQGIWPA
ncbi:hypothetical protein CDD83_6611 [Cordyceps sp. RAO-2017]|nr:hypothetical protein CDD83_6611 [Cordyceps sp. RAO-2017]